MPVSLRSQRGFTTVTLMGVLLVGGMLVMASFAAVDPDIRMTRNDRDGKQAYAAAESGLQWYLNQLANNNAYYTLCENPAAPSPTEAAPVNEKLGIPTSKPFTWRKLPGEQAKYAIELLAVNKSDPNGCTSNQFSMVDRYGNLRLRITGRSRGVSRTILATLRRRNFMDYIYFSQFETLDPATYSNEATATAGCAKFRAQRASWCEEITWISGDDQLGPVHSNDSFQVCGSPQFGRSSSDAIELNGDRAFVPSGSCGANPDVKGTLVHPAGQLEMPPSNASIETVAQPGYFLRGRTDIELNGTVMNVKNRTYFGDSNFHSVSLPANGVIYVANQNATCFGGYNRDNPYGNEDAGCGTVWLKGSYGRDLTIAAANDIIINGSLTRASDDLLLGLVANNFVRVYRPSNWWGGCSNALANLTIQAAILALQHSFIVDNWGCSGSLGNLNVDGAIAQRFRGPVGTTGGAGYSKNYTYNDRLRYREPPYFLDPVEAAWRISRQSEQLPPMSNLPN